MQTNIAYSLPEADFNLKQCYADQLVLKEENIKITMSLKKESIDFFKKAAKKHHTSYQKMIRQVIDWYASHYQKSA
jgi:predicted DNA binding CopG/RHH family protein